MATGRVLGISIPSRLKMVFTNFRDYDLTAKIGYFRKVKYQKDCVLCKQHFTSPKPVSFCSKCLAKIKQEHPAALEEE